MGQVHPLMTQYHALVQHALYAPLREDRTGTGCHSVFGHVLHADLRHGHGFPLLTTKFTNFDAIVRELLWFLSGSTNVNDLHPCKIWDAWADDNGQVGPVYGQQWRAWNGHGGFDQIKGLLDALRTNPTSRRHIVSAWNVDALPAMRLHPCHYAFQCYVESDGALSMMVHQRSADLMLGVPFNIASYNLLLGMLGLITGRRLGQYVHTFGDAHVYANHVEGARVMLSRPHLPAPDVHLIAPEPLDIDCFTVAHFELRDYEHYPAIKLPVAV